MITLILENSSNVTLRTSGTEPKIKYYIEYPGDYDNQVASQKTLHQVVNAVLEDLLDQRRNGLICV